MKIKLFEATGLNEVEDILNKYGYNKGINLFNLSQRDINAIKEILKYTNISFSIENCNRLFSMLLCELKFSYVQQSQRYVKLSSDGYIIPDNIKNSKFAKESKDLIEKSFTLYQKMSKLKKDVKQKGRPKIQDYEYGIPIEDSRYILPLATSTNLMVSLSGDQLLELFSTFKSKGYNELFGYVLEEFKKHIPKTTFGVLKVVSVWNKDRNSLVEDFYKSKFDMINEKNNVVLFDSFKNPIVKTGLGAVTSTKIDPPSVNYTKWGENLEKKSKEITERVLGYGHMGIIEQQRTTFGLMMSMTSYHQYIRHRLPKNHRENLLDVSKDFERKVVVPDTIKRSKFYSEYLELVNEFKNFRKKLIENNLEKEALVFILNCEQIKVISSTNARIDTDIMKDRTCLNAQWEIRNLYLKKLKILNEISPIIYKYAGPKCMTGQCTEGKLFCGKPQVIREIIKNL